VLTQGLPTGALSKGESGPVDFRQAGWLEDLRSIIATNIVDVFGFLEIYDGNLNRESKDY